MEVLEPSSADWQTARQNAIGACDTIQCLTKPGAGGTHAHGDHDAAREADQIVSVRVCLADSGISGHAAAAEQPA